MIPILTAQVLRVKFNKSGRRLDCTSVPSEESLSSLKPVFEILIWILEPFILASNKVRYMFVFLKHALKKKEEKSEPLGMMFK